MFVSNVPGPQVPLFLSGAELLELYGQPPLIENLGLVVSAISYNGKVCFGLTADPDRLPDLADFTDLLRGAFERLRAAAAQVADMPAVTRAKAASGGSGEVKRMRASRRSKAVNRGTRRG